MLVHHQQEPVSNFNYLSNSFTEKNKLNKKDAMKVAYKMMIKGYTLEEIEEKLKWKKRTITKWLGVDWNKSGIKPENLGEEVWACVSFLLEEVYTIAELQQRLNFFYGETLAGFLVQSIIYYYKKYKHMEKHLNLEPYLLFYNLTDDEED